MYENVHNLLIIWMVVQNKQLEVSPWQMKRTRKFALYQNIAMKISNLLDQIRKSSKFNW